MMKINGKIKGFICAAVAAAAYGTNPAFAVPLYEQGMNPVSVLLWRYLISLPILLAMMAWRRQSLHLDRSQLMPVAMLGILMAVSSLGLFESYRYMNAGVASTLLFMYPALVAVMMSFFFGEKFRLATGVCLLVMGAGLIMLMRSGNADSQGGESFSLIGFLLVFISSLTYAIYIVMTNVSVKVRKIPTLKLLFYQLLTGCVVFLCVILSGQQLMLPSDVMGWVDVASLAVLPTALSLCCMTIAIHNIGSTPTAILGALEPVTAVLLSVLFLGQSLTAGELTGGILILIATTMVVASDPVDRALLRMRKLFPRRSR